MERSHQLIRVPPKINVQQSLIASRVDYGMTKYWLDRTQVALLFPTVDAAVCGLHTPVGAHYTASGVEGVAALTPNQL